MTTSIKDSLSGKPVAFISVFDKTGLEPLARALTEQYGYALVSTGGTRRYLEEKKIPSVESSEITGFEELLGGRVKSLHPEIFASILAEGKDRGASASLPFLVDTVVVNLYPFEAERDKVSAHSKDADPDHLLHFIDIGGSALLRSAAKNYPSVSVLSEPSQYTAFIEELAQNKGQPSRAYKKQLALDAFSLTAYYDGIIAEQLSMEILQDNPAQGGQVLSEKTALPLSKINDLRYGENPHQRAALYGFGSSEPDFKSLHGKALSYNNILDMEAAWKIATEFSESMACAIIKHTNPCGVALSSKSVEDAFQRALDTDPLSAFGGVVAYNDIVSEGAAKLMKEMFLEVIIAPGFEDAAFDLLSAKKNIRLVTRELPRGFSQYKLEYKHVSDRLFLVQGIDSNQLVAQEKGFSVVTEVKPTSEQFEDIAFAWKVVKHVKSNAIVLAKNGRTVGIGGGNTSRIGALENALKLACDEAKGSVMASDGFLPHEDNIHAATHAGIRVIIQPGGSIKDPVVTKLASENNIAMITTGIREFKH